MWLSVIEMQSGTSPLSAEDISTDISRLPQRFYVQPSFADIFVNLRLIKHGHCRRYAPNGAFDFVLLS